MKRHEPNGCYPLIPANDRVANQALKVANSATVRIHINYGCRLVVVHRHDALRTSGIEVNS